MEHCYRNSMRLTTVIFTIFFTCTVSTIFCGSTFLSFAQESGLEVQQESKASEKDERLLGAYTEASRNDSDEKAETGEPPEVDEGTGTQETETQETGTQETANHKLIFALDRNTMFIGENQADLETPPFLYDSKSYMPFRKTIELLGGTITYDNGRRLRPLMEMRSTVFLWMMRH